MAGPPVDSLVEAARAEVLKKVLRDRKNRSPEVMGVLDAIANEFFEPHFNVDHLMRAGIVDWRIRKRFRKELGLGLKEYLKELHQTAATWLLVKTDLPIKAIAMGLGYTRERSHNFSRDFKVWTGETPDAYRTARRGKLRGRDGWLERVVGEVLQHEPKTVELPRGLFAYLGGDDDEEMAEVVWAVLREETPARQIELLHSEIFFGGPELFELLSRVSREVGRRDRQVGVRIAEVALAAVEGSRPILGERYTDYRALALARLANAMRLAGDLDGADECFQRTENSRAGRNGRVEAEILRLKGALRLFQRRFSEARELLGTAIEVAEGIGDVTSQVCARLHRAAVAGYEGRPHAAIPDLRAATALLCSQEKQDPLQLLHVYQDLALAYVEIGEIERAKAELTRAKVLCEQLDHTSSRHQLLWIDGLLAKAQRNPRKAERYFRRAKAGFNETGDNYSTAMATLEIAILCQEQDRHAEVLALVTTEVIPVLETLDLRSEALDTLTLLRDSVSKSEVPVTALVATRDDLLASRHAFI